MACVLAVQWSPQRNRKHNTTPRRRKHRLSWRARCAVESARKPLHKTCVFPVSQRPTDDVPGLALRTVRAPPNRHHGPRCAVESARKPPTQYSSPTKDTRATMGFGLAVQWSPRGNRLHESWNGMASVTCTQGPTLQHARPAFGGGSHATCVLYAQDALPSPLPFTRPCPRWPSTPSRCSAPPSSRPGRRGPAAGRGRAACATSPPT